ncbi:sigma-54 dependent transcriptional regulator [Zobellella sp. DQSA1]|uniref:sigma-54 dependent transcriptional regulator n=1 Tax=Zobellella sp. DQSA1 TaxID=3342386 RepID=UPI0035C08ECC
MGFNGCVLIIDNNQERRAKLEAILSFMQVEWRSHEPARGLEWLERVQPGVTVFAGNTGVALADILPRFSRHGFIALDEPGCRADNLLGSLTALTYVELTALLMQARSWRPATPNEQQLGCLQRLLIGDSTPMQEVKTLILQVAAKPANVLLLGESGTGKEVIARAIHQLSGQAQGPFVPINCGAIPAELLESELFGHEKGAFTGAVSPRKGRFELAEGGTLFLDEIGDMPLPMQVKLLRVLQERTFERVGGTRPIRANVRIIAATHRDLEAMIVEQRFREDLYYRLNVFPIEAPPLRLRQGDIPLLLEELVRRHGEAHGAGLDFAPEAVQSLQAYHWPGNVRELSNLVERMFILCPDRVVQLRDLPLKYRQSGSPSPAERPFDELDERDALAAMFYSGPVGEPMEEESVDFGFGAEEPARLTAVPALSPTGINLKEMLANIEVDLIAQALDASEGVVARAAEQLGMRRTTLVEKMKKYGISREF